MKALLPGTGPRAVLTEGLQLPQPPSKGPGREPQYRNAPTTPNPSLCACTGAGLTAVTQAFARPASAQGIKLYIPKLHVSSSFVNYQSWLIPCAPGYYLIFDVQNSGSFDSGPFTVEVRNLSTGYVVESIAVSGIKSGGSRRFWHKLPNPPDCEVAQSRRTILVDSGKVVLETNEANNFTTGNYWYGGDLNHCIH